MTRGVSEVCAVLSAFWFVDVSQTTTNVDWELTTVAWRGTVTTSKARSAAFHALVHAATVSTSAPAIAIRLSVLVDVSLTRPATVSVCQQSSYGRPL